MVAVLSSLGTEVVPVVFADTDWKRRWGERPFFVACNSYLAGVDAFLAALGAGNPTSREEFASRAGFAIGLGTTAPLYSLLANPSINVAADSPQLAGVIEAADRLQQHYAEILAYKSIDALFMPRSVSPLPDLDGDTLRYLGDQVVGTEVNEMGLPRPSESTAGFLADGRPIAVDIVGRTRFTETEILAYAFDFEQATLLRRRPEHEPAHPVGRSFTSRRRGVVFRAVGSRSRSRGLVVSRKKDGAQQLTALTALYRPMFHLQPADKAELGRRSFVTLVVSRL